MAGYYDNVYNDKCFRDFQTSKNEGVYDYIINRKAVMRPDVEKCSAAGLGRTCDFYGPLSGKRVTQSSFLEGRGQTLSECPECDVRYLPASVFPEKRFEARACQNTDLQAEYTRLPKSCNGLQEVDISAYFAMPSNYQKGYKGLDSVNRDFWVQSRENTRDQYQAVHITPESSKQSYGSYDMLCKS